MTAPRASAWRTTPRQQGAPLLNKNTSSILITLRAAAHDGAAPRWRPEPTTLPECVRHPSSRRAPRRRPGPILHRARRQARRRRASQNCFIASTLSTATCFAEALNPTHQRHALLTVMVYLTWVHTPQEDQVGHGTPPGGPAARPPTGQPWTRRRRSRRVLPPQLSFHCISRTTTRARCRQLVCWAPT